MKQRSAFVGTLILFLLFLGLASVTVLCGGCGAKKANNATEAIEQAKTLKSPEQRADYLVSQARSFLSSRDAQEATKTAQYILSSVDTRSQEAKAILDEARSQLASDAKAAIGDAKQKVGL